jgi:riboflavin kinase/FMN adenylyltransferase
VALKLAGVVVRGDGRGRLLGYPTANVQLTSADSVPDDGVYAGRIRLQDGSEHVTALSVGRRPTYYEDGDLLVEAHLLDFDGDLYGQHVELEVGAHVRGQMRFSSGDELVSQIARDVEMVRERDPGAGRRPGVPR